MGCARPNGTPEYIPTRGHEIKKKVKRQKRSANIPLRGIEPRSGRFWVLMRAADASHYTITDVVVTSSQM
jgi:hypothetical protein